MLIAWATYRELDMKGDADRAQAALARFMKDLSRLKYRTQTLADELPVAGSENWSRSSGPAHAFIMRAASSTVRVIGPATRPI